MHDHKHSDPNAAQTRGIVLVIAALALAALSGALMKLLGGQLSPYQVAWFRFAGMSLMLLPYLIWRYGWSGLNPARPWIQLIRGLTMAVATSTFVIGAQTVDYADAIAILYAYPFLLVCIAVVFLGEKANWSVWTGVIAGFVGVLLVMRPDFDRIDAGSLYIFVCAAVISVQLALNRQLSIVAPPLVTAFAGAVCAALALSLLLPGSWQPIPADTWMYIALLIIAGGISQTLLVFAFAQASASTLAPFTYAEIVAAVILGYLMFGTLPSPVSWGGILLISASGIYVARALQVRNIPRRVPKI